MCNIDEKLLSLKAFFVLIIEGGGFLYVNSLTTIMTVSVSIMMILACVTFAVAECVIHSGARRNGGSCGSLWWWKINRRLPH
jgi:hypothetical protein